MEYYNLDGKFMRSCRMMRMYIFNISGLPTPRMVITNCLTDFGLGVYFIIFFHEICEFYNIAPIQLSPNSFHLVIGIYMMYFNLGYEQLLMDELSYFVSLRKSGVTF